MEFDVKKIGDSRDGNARRTLFQTCGKVCSTMIEVTTDGDTITSVHFTNGCHGNTQGVAALCKGMKIKDAADRLEGINCRGRGTSCPDQLAKALRILNSEL